MRAVLLACVMLSTMPALAAGTCEQTAGAKRAAAYVRQCLEVSPATHPPCNAANSCRLIISEIRRGCGMLEAEKRPGFCAGYGR